MERINHADSTHLATASTTVGGSAHAYLMAPAVRNTVGKHLCPVKFKLCHIPVSLSPGGVATFTHCM